MINHRPWWDSDGMTRLRPGVLARHVQLTQEVEEDAASDTLTELGNSRIQHGVLNLVQSHILKDILDILDLRSRNHPPKKNKTKN